MSVRPSVRPSVCRCKIVNKVQVAFIIRFGWFGTSHLFGPRTNPIEIGKNRFRFRYSSHIYFRPIQCKRSLYIFRFARNLVQANHLGLEWCLPSFVKIGPDLDIAPIYIFVRFKVNGVPKSLYIFRFVRNLVQPNHLGLEWCVLSFVKIG